MAASTVIFFRACHWYSPWRRKHCPARRPKHKPLYPCAWRSSNFWELRASAGLSRPRLVTGSTLSGWKGVAVRYGAGVLVKLCFGSAFLETIKPMKTNTSSTTPMAPAAPSTLSRRCSRLLDIKFLPGFRSCRPGRSLERLVILERDVEGVARRGLRAARLFRLLDQYLSAAIPALGYRLAFRDIIN